MQQCLTILRPDFRPEKSGNYVIFLCRSQYTSTLPVPSSFHPFSSTVKQVVIPKLKPSTKTISIRLPESLIEHLKVLANKRDVPYQSLLKMFLSEKVEEEMHGAAK